MLEDASLLDRNRWGEYDPATLSIHLYPNMPQSKRREVLIHECLHAVDDALDTKMKHSAIRSIAHGLAQILDDYLKNV